MPRWTEIRLAKRRDIPIVFCLHNFSYPDPASFLAVGYVFVPSEFSRQYHWERLGLVCHVLPNVLDAERVRVENPQPQYVTFVNPQAVKGAAHARAQRWLPEQAGPRYGEFFSTIHPQPGPPIVPKPLELAP